MRDIELVLRRPDLARFSVRDARSDAPVEHFDLKLLHVRTGRGTRPSSSDREPARVERHEAGEAELAGEPSSHDYAIVAPGYGSQRGRVARDESGTRVQSIRLEPAGTIRGRLLGQDGALPSPVIGLQADRIPLRPGVTEGQDDIFSDDWGSDWDEFAGRVQQLHGNVLLGGGASPAGLSITSGDRTSPTIRWWWS
jgi:hypothetical protein